MSRFWKIFSVAIVLMWFVLGFYLLISSRFSYLTREIRVIFAVFLFLYGGWRLARILTKERNRNNDE